MTYTTTTDQPGEPFDIKETMELLMDLERRHGNIPASLLISSDIEKAVQDVFQSHTSVAQTEPVPTLSIFGLPYNVDPDLPPDTVKVKNAAGEVISTIANIL
ncbi:hypothetical protein [Hwanghaeella sp.]|uniref:hypothetical protein n=1 Tax=Hwanghaeella sp. TaxID=2605943 RepID=UPI003CCC3D17